MIHVVCLKGIKKPFLCPLYFCAAVRAFLLLFLLLTTAQTHAQMRLRRAEFLWSQKQYSEAVKLLQHGLKRGHKTAAYYATLGNWTYGRGQFADAVAAYEEGARKTRKGQSAFSIPLARALFRAGQYGRAANILTEHPPQTTEGRWLLNAARWASTQRPAAVLPRSVGLRINSIYPETFPQLSADGSAFYYTRRTWGEDEDIMHSLPDSCGGWFTGNALPAPVNSLRQERGESFSADGHYLFFGREDLQGENGWEGGGGDLYMAYTTKPGDTTWTAPQPFGATINTPAYEGMPTLSADNQTLYFVSDRAGGWGGSDIWFSHFEGGRWQPPQNAGNEINTAGNELSPFLCADGKTLFFASNGQAQNFGGYDLYRVVLGNRAGRKVENLGLPINSPHDEITPSTGTHGDTLLYATDRDGPGGNLDIWRSSLPDPMRPARVRPVSGVVLDSLSREFSPGAWVSILEAQTATPAGSFRCNRGDASFTAFLEPGKEYLFATRQIGFKKDTVRLSIPDDSLAAPLVRLALLPDGYVAPRHDTLLLRLSFRINEATLNDSLRGLLSSLKPDLLTENAEVFVYSYTDNSGTPILNEEISQTRARLVADVILQQGFPAVQTTVQGWGELQPLASNGTEEGRNQNRRVEVILRR